MNPEIRMTEHERRRYEPWPSPRSRRMPLYLPQPSYRDLRMEREFAPPMRLPLAEIARRIAV